MFHNCLATNFVNPYETDVKDLKPYCVFLNKGKFV